MATTVKRKPLNQSKVVIIGGTSGIGYAVAAGAAATGARVIIASGNSLKVAEAQKRLEGNVTAKVLDVKDENNVKAFFEGVGEFDHLVYTAGENIKLGLLADSSIAESKDYFTVRYWGAIACAKYAAPFLRGSIVFTGGIAANRPGAGWWLGTGICAAMEGITRALSIELAPLRVNLVSPGVVKTPLWDSLTEADRQGMYESYAEKLPVQFVAGPEDIAKSYLYLMEQHYTTGQVLIADGGAVLV